MGQINNKGWKQMIDAMYNAVLVPKVRYHDKLSVVAKLIFCEMTACVDEDQTMDDVPEYFAKELHLSISDVNKALAELVEQKLIHRQDAQPNGFIWVNL